MHHLILSSLRLSLLSAALLLFFTSCTRDTYILNAPNPTLFEKKGDKELNLHLNGKSFQPQWGMAVGNHAAYQVNGYLGFQGQSYIEGIGGVYTKSSEINLEVYTGLGYGYMDYLNGQHSSLSLVEDIDIKT